MDRTRDPDARAVDASASLPTTLYDLIAALHEVVAPHEDALVVAIVADWLRTDRITRLDHPTLHRRFSPGKETAWC